jgi:uncharacterized membrane protein YagU involved in acid resistance
MASAHAIEADRRQVMTSRVVSGAAGGLAGGIVFGLMMDADGMMPMIAMLVGSESAGLGWLLHIGISLFIGATFGLLVGRWLARPVTIVAGIAWGAVWWVLGALLLMPARLGMPVLEINDVTTRSLVGHLVFGAILGVVAWLLARRAA